MVESRFATDIVKITKIINEIPDQSPLTHEELILDPAWCSVQPFKSYLKCVICYGVVWDPKQCAECDSLTCA